MFKNCIKGLTLGALAWASFAATPKKAEADLVGACNVETWNTTNRCYRTTTKIEVVYNGDGGSIYKFGSYSNPGYNANGNSNVTCFDASSGTRVHKTFEFRTRDQGNFPPSSAQCAYPFDEVARTKCGRATGCLNDAP